MPSPAQRTRGLFAAFSSTFFELVGVFMLMPLLLLTLASRGIGASTVGMFAALNWVGIFAITPFAARITRALGARMTFWLSGAIPLLAAVGFLLVEQFALWCALFLVAGLASGLRWIVAEATVAEFAPDEHRGRIVGVFQTMIGITFIVGPALLGATGTHGTVPFAIAIALQSVGFVCSLMIPRPATASRAESNDASSLSVRAAIADGPAVMAAGFVGGAFEAGITGLLPIYGLAIGFDAAKAALLVSASGIGSALLMLPAGELADRFDRHAVSVGSAVVILFGACLLPLVPASKPLIWIVAFAWGGAGGALYTIAMVDIGTRLRGNELVNGAAVLVMAYTLGGVLAPALGGYALEHAPRVGFPALFIVIAASGLASIAFAQGRERRGSSGTRRGTCEPVGTPPPPNTGTQ